MKTYYFTCSCGKKEDYEGKQADRVIERFEDQHASHGLITIEESWFRAVWQKLNEQGKRIAKFRMGKTKKAKPRKQH